MKTRRPTPEPALAAAGLCLLGLGLRLFMLGEKSLWFDEAVTILAARSPGGETALVEPPLYTILLRMWLSLPIPHTEFLIRLPSALLSALALPVAYRVARAWLPPAGALLALALMAVSPWEVSFAQEARPYSLVLLLSLLSTAWVLRALHEPPLVPSVIYAILGLLGFLAHPGFVFLVPAHLILLASARAWRTLLYFVLAMLASAIPGALWFTVILPGVTHTLANPAEAARPTIKFLLETLEAWGPGPFLREGVRPIGLLAFASATALGLVFHVPRRRFVLAAFAFLPLFLVQGLVALGLLHAPMLRYAVGGHFFFLICAAAMASPPRRVRWLVASALLLLEASSLAGWYAGSPPLRGGVPGKKPLRAVAAFISARAAKGDSVVSLSPSSAAPLRLYLSTSIPQSYVMRDPTIPPRMESLVGSPATLRDSVRGRRRVWLVVSPVRFSDLPEIPRRMMPEIDRLLREPVRFEYPGVDVYLAETR